MAKLGSGRNGSELLRVEREEDNGTKRMLSFMSKGPVLEKVGKNVDGAWYSTGWKVRAKRDIGSDEIQDMKASLETNGWRVVFYGVRKFGEKRTKTQRNETKRTKPQAPKMTRRKGNA